MLFDTAFVCAVKKSAARLALHNAVSGGQGHSFQVLAKLNIQLLHFRSTKYKATTLKFKSLLIRISILLLMTLNHCTLLSRLCLFRVCLLYYLE